ncbi:HNH endonuclease [Stutzerimonas stutzeri]|uniref:HNH endonuclease n=1 Tax=Stutzerimonas stutzeri TaxID=316 RepID=UPI002446FFB4|nr:HNH endonuclease [Stutzerimonas stutzeri]MDH0157327.1 HNH endonuclease [Stutzerimonas stutzeri]
MQLISHEKLVEIMHYSPETGVFTRRKKVNQMPTEAGSTDKQGYRRIHLLGKVYRAHRLAWFYLTGEWPSAEIDHINGDRSDNRISNLRQCTHQQNNHNQPIRRNNRSGVKGVHWDRRLQKWHAQVCLNFKVHHVGHFDDLSEAALAVMDQRKKLHGEFANHG